jgi:hypothetical protein
MLTDGPSARKFVIGNSLSHPVIVPKCAKPFSRNQDFEQEHTEGANGGFEKRYSLTVPFRI